MAGVTGKHGVEFSRDRPDRSGFLVFDSDSHCGDNFTVMAVVDWTWVKCHFHFFLIFKRLVSMKSRDHLMCSVREVYFSGKVALDVMDEVGVELYKQQLRLEPFHEFYRDSGAVDFRADARVGSADLWPGLAMES